MPTLTEPQPASLPEDRPFDGLFPPPTLLAKYEAIAPGFTEKLVEIAVDTAETRKVRNTTLGNGQNRDIALAGSFSLALCLIGIAGSMFCLRSGASLAGYILIGDALLTGAVSAFAITRFYPRNAAPGSMPNNRRSPDPSMMQRPIPLSFADLESMEALDPGHAAKALQLWRDEYREYLIERQIESEQHILETRHLRLFRVMCVTAGTFLAVASLAICAFAIEKGANLVPLSAVLATVDGIAGVFLWGYLPRSYARASGRKRSQRPLSLEDRSQAANISSEDSDAST